MVSVFPLLPYTDANVLVAALACNWKITTLRNDQHVTASAVPKYDPPAQTFASTQIGEKVRMAMRSLMYKAG